MRHFFKGMQMQRKILTLKQKVTPSLPPEQSLRVPAGRTPPKGAKTASAALIKQLTELVCAQRKTFVQMRNGTGYCGTPILLQDGWLTMELVSIHGTKQSATATTILIQINDGSFIAHLHPTSSSSDSQSLVGAKS
jgi:hypothetical protein